MRQWVAGIGKQGICFCQQLTLATIFFFRVLFVRPRLKDIRPLFTVQIFRVGILSLVIILLSALFIGMVVSLQGYNTLVKFGAEQELGQLLALSVLRELAPVVGALLFAGRAGSALTAEIGLMRATEQISSMELMGVNPLWHIISPRLWACIISLPILIVFFDATSICGGVLVGVNWLGIDWGSFWSNMQHAVHFREDVVNGLIKSVIFAVVIAWVAVFQGYYAQPNSRGIGIATTKTVVYSSLLILGLDFVLTAMMMGVA